MRRRSPGFQDPSEGLDALFAELPFPELLFFRQPITYHIPRADDPWTWAAKHDDTYQRRRRLIEDLHRRWYENARPWDLAVVLSVIRQAKREMIHSRPHGMAYRFAARFVAEKAEHQARLLKLARKVWGLDWHPPEFFDDAKMPVPEGRPGRPWKAEVMRRLRTEAHVWRRQDREAFLRAYGILDFRPRKTV